MSPKRTASNDWEPGQETDPVRLLQHLKDHYSLDELKDLCFEVGVNWDDLPGEARSSKARELIELLKRQERLDVLASKILERGGHGAIRESSLWKELMGCLGISQKWFAKRAIRAIDRGWVSDAEVHETLSLVRSVVDRFRQDPDAVDNSLLATLAERLSRKLGANAPERYRLMVAAPMIALILNSPERLALEDATSLRDAWKRLTRLQPPTRRAWICIGAAGCVVAYGVLLAFIQPRELGDEFVGEKNGVLNSRLWEYPKEGLRGWTTPNDYLQIKGPGLALLNLDSRKPKPLDNFTLSFLAVIESGNRLAWVLRAQEYAKIEQLRAYAFSLTIDDSKPARLFLEGKRLPGGESLDNPDGEVRIQDFRQQTDALQVEVAVKGSKFVYTFSRQALEKSVDTRSSAPGFARPVSVTLADPNNTYHHGRVGLLGVGKRGGAIHIESVHVKPNWKWFF